MYIPKYRTIIQFGLLKMRADFECLNLAFNEFTFFKNFKGDNLRPPREGFFEKDNLRHKTIFAEAAVSVLDSYKGFCEYALYIIYLCE